MLHQAIRTMTERLTTILAPQQPSIYLYGSVPLADFRPGWSDIDLLVLTEIPITETQAKTLVDLRQTMLAAEPDNPYYRSFEGGMLTRHAFCTGEPDKVIYWGTSGQRITDHYVFDSFCMAELLDSGVLLAGPDMRATLTAPTFAQLYTDVQRHYETIRQYGQGSRSLYAYGWLLDIARCLYTLRTGKIIAKTAAAKWALENELCPDRAALEAALRVRLDPLRWKKDATTMDYAETLTTPVQQFADVLEKELEEKRV